MAEFAVRSTRVVAPDGTRPGAVLVEAGRITAVVPPGEVPRGLRVVDAGRAAVLPGLVDTHVHVNEPGRTEWEGFETATRAAAAGGVTTIVDMPLNSSPVTTSVAALEAKIAAARGKIRVDCGFWGGLVPGNTADLEPLLDAGVLGFKAFLVHSGIDEFRNATEADLRSGMPILARRGARLLAHAELQGPGTAGNPEVPRPAPEADPRSYAGYLASRPRAWEHEAIRLLIDLCRETGCPTHIVHLSSADAVGRIREALAGLPLSVETCPHYLVFAAEEVADGATEFKCAPPIRERENRERLWDAVLHGPVSMIVSDHSPAPPAMKRRESGDFTRAWGGISSLEVGLAAVWTEGSRRGLSLEGLAERMSAAPARLAGLERRKGAIEAGRDADLVVFDPDAEWTVEPESLAQRHKLTPYAGRRLRGRVERTLLRGREIYVRGDFPGAPAGEIILRGR
jgi:allantoinase